MKICQNSFAALVNKLVPWCAWLLSSALEVLRLRLRLRVDRLTHMHSDRHSYRHIHRDIEKQLRYHCSGRYNVYRWIRTRTDGYSDFSYRRVRQPRNGKFKIMLLM